MASGKGITSMEIEKFFDNETNEEVKETLWVFTHQIQ